jgi:hypothetical protein
MYLSRARPITLGAVHSHHYTPSKPYTCLSLATLKMSSKIVSIPPQATMATRIWPPAQEPLSKDILKPAQTAVALQVLASGPEATVKGRPYTGSDHHGCRNLSYKLS